MARQPISNVEFWNSIRAGYPNFKNITAKGTYDMFSANGYEQLKNNNYQALNEFFGLSLQVFLQKVDVSQTKDLLEGVFESYDMPLGAVIRRLAVYPLLPVSPAFHNLVDGGSVDPFIIRKPKTKERFWHNPISYQNVVTLQEFQMKEIFISPFGMDEYIGGILAQLENSLREWKVENKLNAISTGINSTDFPLQPTQKRSIDAADLENLTDAELREFLLSVSRTITAMTVNTRTSSFNANKFSTTQDKSRLTLLVRAGFKDQLKNKTLAGTFHPDQLNLDVEVREVPNFGGLEPYQDPEFNTRLYPVYDAKLGYFMGWNTEEGQSVVTIEPEATVYYKDTNADVFAILVDRGWIFETITNGVSSTNAYNARALYMDYYLNMPNYYTSIDSNRNVVVFSNEVV